MSVGHDGRRALRPDTNGPVDDDDAFYRTLVERARHMTVVYDAGGKVTYVSPACGPMLGTTPTAGLGTDISLYISPEDLPRCIDALMFKMEHPEEPFRPLLIETRGIDGRRVPMEVVGRPDTNLDEGIAVLERDASRRLMMQDIMDSVMRSEPIDTTLELIAGLVSDQLLLEGLTIAYDRRDDGFAQIVGVGTGAVLAQHCRRLDAGLPWTDALRSDSIVVRERSELDGALSGAMPTAGHLGCWCIALRSRDGEVLGCLTAFSDDHIRPVAAERNLLTKLARTAAFALERWNRDQAVTYAATHDALTGAFNRSTFADHVTAAVAGPAERDRDRRNVLLSIDLDGFKLVNDQHGHLVGDAVLVAVTERIHASVRPHDIVARLGGDEYAVLCPGLTIAEATAVAERIIDAIQRPIVVGGTALAVAASIGIAIDDTDPAADPGIVGPPGTSLFVEADRAMYAAKEAGKGRWRLASDSGRSTP